MLKKVLAVLLFYIRLASAQHEITILHTSELNSRFNEMGPGGGICKSDCEGGYCRYYHYLQQIVKEKNDLIYINTGNTLGGGYFDDERCKPELSGSICKFFGKQYTTFGANELFIKVESLKNYISNCKDVTFLCCNAEIPSQSSLGSIKSRIKKSSIRKIGKVKVGIIGFTSSKVQQTSESLKNIKFLEEQSPLEEEIRNLLDDGVKIIIVFGYASPETSKELLSLSSQIDVVVSGGMVGDNRESELMYPIQVLLQTGRRTVILRCIGYGMYMGLTSITFSKDGQLLKYTGDRIRMNSSIPKDEKCDEHFKDLCASALSALSDNKGLGKIDSFLDHNRYPCTIGECNLGSFIADAMVHTLSQDKRSNFWANAPMAVIPAFAITGNINASGNDFMVGKADLMLALGGSDMKVAVVDLKGPDLLKMLEDSVARKGGLEFLQVSGLQVHYDFSQSPGDRVVTALARFALGKERHYRPILSNTTYSFITLEQLYKKDLIHNLRTKISSEKPIPEDVITLVSKYLEWTKYKRTLIDGRIKITNAGVEILFSKIVSCLCLLCWIIF